MDKVDAYDKEQLQAMGWLFDEIETPDTAVRFVEQDLTSAQKDTVLSNIGLDFVHVDYSELSTTLSDDRLSQIVNAKGLILTNTPDNYIRSVVFTAGTRVVSAITFSSIENSQNINYIILNIPNKILSLVQTSGLVLSSSNQNLTDAQKQRARSNIGAQSADELLADDNFIAQLKTKLGL